MGVLIRAGTPVTILINIGQGVLHSSRFDVPDPNRPEAHPKLMRNPTFASYDEAEHFAREYGMLYREYVLVPTSEVPPHIWRSAI